MADIWSPFICAVTFPIGDEKLTLFPFCCHVPWTCIGSRSLWACAVPLAKNCIVTFPACGCETVHTVFATLIGGGGPIGRGGGCGGIITGCG